MSLKITHSTRTKAVQQYAKQLQEPNVGPHQQSGGSGGTPKGCSAEGGLSPSTAFLQHPPKHPASHSAPRSPAGSSAANRIFFPCFAFQRLTETSCKTPQEGRVYNTLQSKPGQQRPSPQAYIFWVKTFNFGMPRVSPHPNSANPNPAPMLYCDPQPHSHVAQHTAC